MSRRQSILLLTRVSQLLLALVLATAMTGCGDDDDGKSWQVIVKDLPGAMLTIWGTTASDVWAAGGDARDGTGPLVLHYDGAVWTRIETGETEGNLWWIFGFEGGPIFMGGDGGTILRYENGAFTKMTTPGTGTIYGLWGASPTDMWAVGTVTAAAGGFAWRLSGEEWVDEPTLPADLGADTAIWKVFGRNASDVWLVGGAGSTLHYDGETLTPIESGASTSLFNIHCNDELFVAVGGDASGVILEYDGTRWNNATPESSPGFTGLFLNPDNTGFAVGQYGLVFERVKNSWQQVDLGFYVEQALHSTWVDSEGGMWAVGGQSFVTPLTDGLIIHYGAKVDAAGL